MAWRRTGDKPLSEPMLTWFTDIYAAQGGDELIKQQNKYQQLGLNIVHLYCPFYWHGLNSNQYG